MKIIKGTTAQGKRLYEQHTKYDGYWLHDVYNKPSVAKQNAWNKCFDMFVKENGTGFSITSHNSFNVTCSWIIEEGLRIETASNSYLVLFPENC